MSLPRGIRNGNPGDLEYGAFAKKMGAIGSDGRFAVFARMQDGIRAMAENLIGYQELYGIYTVAAVIRRWAPSNENNTDAYIAFVCHVLECEPDDQFDFHDPDFLFWMVTAIGEEENGHDAFTHNVSDEDIEAGVAAALA